MSKKKYILSFIVIPICISFLMVNFAIAGSKDDRVSKAKLLGKIKPNFDPSGAKYVCKVSNITTPFMKCSAVGLAIRDELWKKTKGQLYFEYLPFGVLGGEVEVLSQLQMGAIQGMGCNSHIAPNLGPRMGIMTLPFLINNYYKLEKFMANEQLFQQYLGAMEQHGIMGVDVTGYGLYGWNTTIPIKNVVDLKKVRIRISESEVAAVTYKNWGVNPIVMPFPDIAVSLKQGVINAFDHTVTACWGHKYMEIAKYYAPVSYCQGLFVWIFNKAWFNKLPKNLQKTFLDVVHQQCSEYRYQARRQDDEYVDKAKNAGITFENLSDDAMKLLLKGSIPTHRHFEKRIGAKYVKAVQDYLGFWDQLKD